jgi:glucosyl-3-phosphoglycerate synthase
VTDWFARRTYHHRAFADLPELLRAKESRGLGVSVCIPTLNEAATIGPILRSIRTSLIEELPLVDELVVIDSESEDDTVPVARTEGAKVFQDREILPGRESFTGKGEALWKSLFVLQGDLVVWLDADIENFDPRFVYGTLGPLLLEPEVGYVKAFYDRPVKQLSGSGQGGRVTELLARPLLNLFWPELGQLVQPLSGEYAGRRDVLSQVPFFSGYGVEIGMLIDVFERFGMDCLAQVDLERREHRNRPIAELSRMSFAVLQAALARLRSSGRIQLGEEPNTLLTQFVKEGDRYELAPTEIRVRERPPAATLPEYR